ncbi:hypothetical protein ACWGTO_33160, partial [Mesorhizobium sp. PL10]
MHATIIGQPCCPPRRAIGTLLPDIRNWPVDASPAQSFPATLLMPRSATSLGQICASMRRDAGARSQQRRQPKNALYYGDISIGAEIGPSPVGADRAAIMLSVITTCRLNEV